LLFISIYVKYLNSIKSIILRINLRKYETKKSKVLFEKDFLSIDLITYNFWMSKGEDTILKTI
jgi:hypothetical protein